MKKSLLFIEVIFILFIVFVAIDYKEGLVVDRRQEEIELLAIETSESIYLGQHDYFTSNTSKYALDNINNTILKTRGSNIKSIEVDRYIDEFKKENKAIVVIKIYEEPFKHIIYHEITFINTDDKWIIDDFTVES